MTRDVQRRVDAHIRALVAAHAAVLRGGEYRQELLVVRVLKAAVHHLVRADHQVEVVVVQEALRDVRAKVYTRAAVAALAACEERGSGCHVAM